MSAGHGCNAACVLTLMQDAHNADFLIWPSIKIINTLRRAVRSRISLEVLFASCV